MLRKIFKKTKKWKKKKTKEKEKEKYKKEKEKKKKADERCTSSGGKVICESNTNGLEIFTFFNTKNGGSDSPLFRLSSV